MVKTLPAMRETWVRSLVRKIPWRRAWQPGILAWRIPWTEESGGLQSMESQESDMTRHSIDHDALICRIVTKQKTNINKSNRQ